MGVRKWWFEAPSTTPAGDAVAYGFGGRGIAFIEYPLAANSIGILYLADAIESPPLSEDLQVRLNGMRRAAKKKLLDLYPVWT